MQILLFGHVCIDENISEKVNYTSWGSPLMYMAKHFRNYPDANVSLLAPYGKDFVRYADQVSFINPPLGNHTLTYKNISVDGERTQVAENTEHASPVHINEKIKRVIKNADIIVLGTLLANYPYTYIREIMKYKNRDCLCVILPQGFFRRVDIKGRVSYEEFEEAEKILPLFDIAILSDSDINYDMEAVRSWTIKSPKIKVVITEGEAGASYITENGQESVRTTLIPENEIVDSVGCGDTFSAALAYSFFKNGDLEAAIRSGNKAAGEKLRKASPLR